MLNNLHPLPNQEYCPYGRAAESQEALAAARTAVVGNDKATTFSHACTSVRQKIIPWATGSPPFDMLRNYWHTDSQILSSPRWYHRLHSLLTNNSNACLSGQGFLGSPIVHHLEYPSTKLHLLAESFQNEKVLRFPFQYKRILHHKDALWPVSDVRDWQGGECWG